MFARLLPIAHAYLQSVAALQTQQGASAESNEERDSGARALELHVAETFQSAMLAFLTSKRKQSGEHGVKFCCYCCPLALGRAALKSVFKVGSENASEQNAEEELHNWAINSPLVVLAVQVPA